MSEHRPSRFEEITQQFTNTPEKKIAFERALVGGQAVLRADPTTSRLVKNMMTNRYVYNQNPSSQLAEQVARHSFEQSFTPSAQAERLIWGVALNEIAKYFVENDYDIEDPHALEEVLLEQITGLASRKIASTFNITGADEAQQLKQTEYMDCAFVCYALAMLQPEEVIERVIAQQRTGKGVGFQRVVGQPLTEALQTIHDERYEDKAAVYRENLQALFDLHKIVKAKKDSELPAAPVELLRVKIFSGDDEALEALVQDVVAKHKAKKARQRAFQTGARLARQDSSELPAGQTLTDIEIAEAELMAGIDPERAKIIAAVTQHWLKDPTHRLRYAKGYFHGKPPTADLDHLDGYILCLLEERVGNKDVLRYIVAESLQEENALYVINKALTDEIIREQTGITYTWEQLTSLKRFEVEAVGGRPVIHVASQGEDLYSSVSRKAITLLQAPAEAFRDYRFHGRRGLVPRQIARTALSPTVRFYHGDPVQ